MESSMKFLLAIGCTYHLLGTQPTAVGQNVGVIPGHQGHRSEILTNIHHLESRINLIERENRILNQDVSMLKRQIFALGQPISACQTEHQADPSKNCTAKTIAFSSILSHSVNPVFTGLTIPFNHVHTNIGNAYNPASGVFHVPEDGLYQLFVNIIGREDNGTDHWLTTDLFVDAKKEATLPAHGQGVLSDSKTLNLNLAKGSDVWVKVTYTDGLYVSIFSSFSGHLIKRTCEIS